jgi:hypothetical protein
MDQVTSSVSIAVALVAEHAQGGLLACFRQPLGNGDAGALQGTGHGCHRRVELAGGLCRREAGHLTQEQDGALQGRQVLHGGDER